MTTPWQHPDCYSGLHLYVIRLQLDQIGKTHRQAAIDEKTLRYSGRGGRPLKTAGAAALLYLVIAFTALRIATTGSTISPPLFESMELLGKEACLLRINAGLAL